MVTSRKISPPLATTFFNTGRNVLNAFDYLYDGQNGYVGLSTNGLVPTNANLSFSAGFYPNPVPEPSTYALFGLGGMALVIATRVKRA